MSYALEKFKNKGEFETPLISKWFPEFFGAFFGSFLAMGINWKKGRPLASAIPRYAFYITGSVVICHFLDKWREAHLAERDAMIKHYIELHPEDFPEPVRKKYSEVFEPWVPCR